MDCRRMAPVYRAADFEIDQLPTQPRAITAKSPIGTVLVPKDSVQSLITEAAHRGTVGPLRVRASVRNDPKIMTLVADMIGLTGN